MSPRNPRDWFLKAERDLGLAYYAKGRALEYPDLICFHCQQAAEKFLKAIVVYHKLTLHKKPSENPCRVARPIFWRYASAIFSAIGRDYSLKNQPCLTPKSTPFRLARGFQTVSKTHDLEEWLDTL